MVKPRGKVVRGSFSPGLTKFGEIESLKIAAWCPDPEAKKPPEQVHLIIRIEEIDDVPLVVRFKSPDTLGFLIEELARYRQEVWPNAEPVSLSASG